MSGDRTYGGKIRHPRTCVVCGGGDGGGLGLRMRAEGRRVLGEVALDGRHEGAVGYAHGGVIAALLDDTLGTLPMFLDWPAVTGRLEVTYRAPALINRSYALEAWIERTEGRKAHLAGELRDADRSLIAEGRAIFVRVDVEHFVRGARSVADGVPVAAEQLPW